MKRLAQSESAADGTASHLGNEVFVRSPAWRFWLHMANCRSSSDWKLKPNRGNGFANGNSQGLAT